MELTISYRPFGGNVLVWNTMDDTMPLFDRKNIENNYFSPDGDQMTENDEWFTCVAVYENAFHCLNVLDRHGRGSLWASLARLALDQYVIDRITEQLDAWDNEVGDKSEILSYTATRFRTNFTVAERN
jgi:hypothetical protein